PGGLLALFSDGIPEAQRGEEFFDDRRLHEALLAEGATADLQALRGGILGRVDDFLAGAPRTDDITLVLVRREAAAAPKRTFERGSNGAGWTWASACPALDPLPPGASPAR